ncbi:MAG: hypothetical protein ACTS6G_03575 [Candidatus Hodgkinia cicadicola]
MLERGAHIAFVLARIDKLFNPPSGGVKARRKLWKTNMMLIWAVRGIMFEDGKRKLETSLISKRLFLVWRTLLNGLQICLHADVTFGTLSTGGCKPCVLGPSQTLWRGRC